MSKQFTLKELGELLKTTYIGNPEFFITGVSELKNAKETDLCFLFEEKYFNFIDKTKSKCFLVNKNFETKKYSEFVFLVSENPKLLMSSILNIFQEKYNLFKSIHSNTFISTSAKINSEVSINPFVYIGENVVIEKNVTIFPNCFIGDRSIISENTTIYPNVSILSDTNIGKNVIIHSGCVIGSDGYGYIQLNGNLHHKIPQIGNVIIEDDVEIGSNVSIDRGTLNSTIIKKGTKIDNLVHIAHNVQIGERNLLVAQSGIAGSSKIGDDVIIAGQAGVTGHIEIGNKSMVLAKSGVTKSFPDNSKISGFPARNHRDELKNLALIKKIPDLINKISELENEITKLKNML